MATSTTDLLGKPLTGAEPELLAAYETLKGLAGCAVEATVGAIITSVKAHADGAPQSDDIAVLALRRN